MNNDNDSSNKKYIPPHRRRSIEESSSSSPLSIAREQMSTGRISRRIRSTPRQQEFSGMSGTSMTPRRLYPRTPARRTPSSQWRRNHHHFASAATFLHSEHDNDDNDNDHNNPHHILLHRVISEAYCINLASRSDKWQTFQQSAYAVSSTFAQSIQRFEAVDGMAHQCCCNNKNNHDNDNHHDNINHNCEYQQDVQTQWDSTTNAKYSPKEAPGIRTMLPGEVGCALSHVALWRKLVATTTTTAPTSTTTEEHKDIADATLHHQQLQLQQQQNLLILEDDSSFARTMDGQDRFVTAFCRAWQQLPNDWGIFYLGFSSRGQRKYVNRNHQGRQPQQQCNNGHGPATDGVWSRRQQQRHSEDEEDEDMNRNAATDAMMQTATTNDEQFPEIAIFTPEYGYHTHAYMITRSAAQRLLQHLPVVGPIDVWLADHQWFGIPTYCAVIANEGWMLDDGTYEGVPLVQQTRGWNFQSDVSPRPKARLSTSSSAARR